VATPLATAGIRGQEATSAAARGSWPWSWVLWVNGQVRQNGPQQVCPSHRPLCGRNGRATTGQCIKITPTTEYLIWVIATHTEVAPNTLCFLQVCAPPLINKQFNSSVEQLTSKPAPRHALLHFGTFPVTIWTIQFPVECKCAYPSAQTRITNHLSRAHTQHQNTCLNPFPARPSRGRPIGLQAPLSSEESRTASKRARPSNSKAPLALTQGKSRKLSRGRPTGRQPPPYNPARLTASRRARQSSLRALRARIQSRRRRHSRGRLTGRQPLPSKKAKPTASRGGRQSSSRVRLVRIPSQSSDVARAGIRILRMHELRLQGRRLG
jgi:hypothetical protein